MFYWLLYQNVENSLKFSPRGEELIDGPHITFGTLLLFTSTLPAAITLPCLFVYLVDLFPIRLLRPSQCINRSPVAIFLSLQFNLKRPLFFNVINIAPSLQPSVSQNSLFEHSALKTHISPSSEKFVWYSTNSDVVFVKRITHTYSNISTIAFTYVISGFVRSIPTYNYNLLCHYWT